MKTIGITKLEANKVLRWLTGDDTGMSSKYLASISLGLSKEEISYPCDPSDFGRCYRFLDKCINPEKWEKILSIAAVKSVHWKKIFDNWDGLKRLWEKECNQVTAPELWDCMKKLGL